jgi:hypothetical protein
VSRKNPSLFSLHDGNLLLCKSCYMKELNRERTTG